MSERQFILTMHEDDSVTMHAYVEDEYSTAFYIEVIDEYGAVMDKFYWNSNSIEDTLKSIARIYKGKKKQPIGAYVQKTYKVGYKQKYSIHPAFDITDY